MVLVDSRSLDHEPISSMLIKIIITVFTFLTAFSIRDSVTQGIKMIAPNDASKNLAFTSMITMIFLFTTVVMAYSWQDKIDGSA